MTNPPKEYLTPSYLPQRTTGFNGGIQSGCIAFDSQSKDLDSNIKIAAQELSPQMDAFGISFQKRLTKTQKNNLQIEVGFEPDGGLWFYKNSLVAAFEGKKQGLIGNAIERWSKNKDMVLRFDQNAAYVTFGVGEGFTPKGYPYKFAKTYLRDRDFNYVYPTGLTWMISNSIFSKEYIFQIMKLTITLNIQSRFPEAIIPE